MPANDGVTAVNGHAKSLGKAMPGTAFAVSANWEGRVPANTSVYGTKTIDCSDGMSAHLKA